MIKSLIVETERLEPLQEAGNFKAERIVCVGGGSKNCLRNQLRADVCQVPIQLINQKETTVLGASFFVFSGTNIFENVDDARNQIDYKPTVIHPNHKDDKRWDKQYHSYLKQKE